MALRLFAVLLAVLAFATSHSSREHAQGWVAMAAPHRTAARMLATAANSSSSGSSSGNRSSSADMTRSSSLSGGLGGGTGATRTRAETTCSPSMLAVARQLTELRQTVQLAAAGYSLFLVDGGKNFTAFAPSNTALQSLAAAHTDSDERQQLQDGFYSVILYNQLPQGAYDSSELIALGDVQTSLGLALNKGKDAYTVSIDGRTVPAVATGGWPANNAKLLSSHEACDGWLHVVDAVLLPAKGASNLPRLVDTQPDLAPDSFWALLDGSNVSSLAAEPSPAQAEGGSGGGGSSGGGSAGSVPPPAWQNMSSGTVVSSGSGGSTDASPEDVPLEGISSSSDGGSNRVLVVAASAAGAAVAACAVVVMAVTLRKRHLRRQRHLHNRLSDEFDASVTKSPSRPVQLHVDA